MIELNRPPHGVTHYRTGINPAVCEESGRIETRRRRRDAFAVGSSGDGRQTRESLIAKGASRPIRNLPPARAKE
ncbi:hypothetical protein ES703_09181 [subsurface metagenome]